MKRVFAGLLTAAIAMSAEAGMWQDKRIAAEVDRAPAVAVRPDVEVRALDGALSAADLDRFANMAQQGVLDIERLTGVHRDRAQRIVVYLSPRIGASHTFPHWPASAAHEPRVFIDSERVADGDAPYLHELVHAVVGDGGAMWLEEGFAEWAASTVARHDGGYYAPVMSADNERVDAEARQVLAAGARDVPAWFAQSSPDFASQHDRRAFYILSHSFTKFLAERLGTRELVRSHRAEIAASLAKEWEPRWEAAMTTRVVRSTGRVSAAPHAAAGRTDPDRTATRSGSRH